MKKINGLSLVGASLLLAAASATALAKDVSPEKLQQQAEVFKALKESAPPQAFEKLTAEQTQKVILEAIRAASRKEDSPVAETVKALLFFLAVVSAFMIPIYLRNRRYSEFQRTIQMMVEKGVTIPEAVVQLGVDGGTAIRDWRRGVLLLAFGGGLIACLLIVNSTAWGIGAIPVALGVASLFLAKSPK